MVVEYLTYYPFPFPPNCISLSNGSVVSIVSTCLCMFLNVVMIGQISTSQLPKIGSLCSDLSKIFVYWKLFVSDAYLYFAVFNGSEPNI